MDADDAGDTRLYALLAGLDARYRALERRLPDASAPAPLWVGVLFRLRARAFLAPLDQIAEVLELPGDLTAIAGTRPWVLGVANHRGALLPIFDLAALAEGVPPARRPSDRVLAVRQDELLCGLAVSETIGIRRLDATARSSGPPAGLGMLAPFADYAYALAGETVPVLALDRLVADPVLVCGAG